MKNFIFLLAFVILSLTAAKAQKSYSCSFCTTYTWNEADAKFTDVAGDPEISVFVVNKPETMLTHTIGKKKMTYTIVKKQFDKEKQTFNYNVKNKEGVEYFFTIDAKNKEIKATYLVYEDIPMMLSYKVEKVY